MAKLYILTVHCSIVLFLIGYIQMYLNYYCFEEMHKKVLNLNLAFGVYFFDDTWTAFRPRKENVFGIEYILSRAFQLSIKRTN